MSNHKKKLKVLTFSFNTNDIKLCSKEQELKCSSSFKSKYICSYCKKQDCYIPQFFKLLAEYAIESNADIVYIATQNDHLTDEHNLHRDYLIKYFKRFGKILKQRIKTGLLKRDIDMKSSHYHSFLKSGLSSTIFVSHNYLKKTAPTKTNPNNHRDTSLRVMKRDFIQCNTFMHKTKGGLYTRLKIYETDIKNSPTPYYHYVTFLNVNLKKTGADKDQRDIWLNDIFNDSVPEGNNRNTLICCGCFNYDKLAHFNTQDELSLSLSSKSIQWMNNKIYETTNISKYDIPFPPTCMLKKTRSDKYDKCDVPADVKKKYAKDSKKLIKKKTKREGSNNEYYTYNTDNVIKQKHSINNLDTNLTHNRKLYQCSSSSIKKCKYTHVIQKSRDEIYDKEMKWCERILYSSYPDMKHIKCTEYSSYDFGQFMANSKHRAVYSHVDITL